jgi:hypothetical protein
MNSIFNYKDNNENDNEGKIGIGKLPENLENILDNISKEYNNLIPNKNASTYHTWYCNMPPSIKENVKRIQQDDFWHNLCDGNTNCRIFNTNEVDELYYSNPSNDLDKINLYGTVSNYGIHQDGIYNFIGIKYYRVIIGLTNGNDNIITYFTKFKVGKKINKGDYIVFDFDKSTHQVIKDSEKRTPRILLKLHFIVCENAEYSQQYIEFIKQLYLYYEFITRYIVKIGTDPKTYPQFFLGLACQYFYTPAIKYVVLFLSVITVFCLNYFYNVELFFSNIFFIFKYIFVFISGVFLLVVLFYWLRYQMLGIR